MATHAPSPPIVPGLKGTVVQLQRASWPEIHRALTQLWGERLRTERSEYSEVAAYAMSGKEHLHLQLLVHARSRRIQLQGSEEMTRAMARVLKVLDQPPHEPGIQAKVVTLRDADPAKVRFALETYKHGVVPRVERSNPRTRVWPPGPALVTRLFERRMQPGDAQPGDAQPGVPPRDANNAQPGVGNTAPNAPGQLNRELTGSVRIEQIEGLDAFVITGNDSDVQRVVEIIDAIQNSIEGTEPVVEVYPLRNVDSEVLGAMVRQLYDDILSLRQGQVSITSLVKPNALLLIGRKDSVETVRELIRRLDQPVGPGSQFEVFRLKYASAASAQATIQEFFTERTGLGTKVLVTADFRTNSLIVQASPRDMAELTLMIKKLDTIENEAINELRVFP
ncbi:MAG: hypothetical protein N2C14_07980, partial [Planctomycetales bacterium]